MANIYLNLGINVADLYKDIDKAQLNQIQQAAADGFSTAELKTLEEDGIDVSLIKDNAVEQVPIEEKETDSAELKEAKAKLIEINKKILDNTTEQRELEADIIFLEDEVNTEFEELVDKQQALEEKQKDDIKEAQAKLQEKFASSEGEMTKDDYEDSLGDEMDKIDTKYGTKFSSIAVDFAKNNKKAAELATKIETQNKLITETDDLKTEADELTKEIQIKQQEHDVALAAAQAAENNGGTHPKRNPIQPAQSSDTTQTEQAGTQSKSSSENYETAQEEKFAQKLWENDVSEANNFFESADSHSAATVQEEKFARNKLGI